MNQMTKELVRAAAEQLADKAEAHRREKPVMNAVPLSPDTDELDYAPSAQMITTAMTHLDEGLPNGQKIRNESAAQLLAIGAAALLSWMKAKGYDVPNLRSQSVPLPVVDQGKGAFGYVGTDKTGKRVLMGTIATDDPAEISRMLAAAHTLVSAIRRGVPVDDATFAAHVQNREPPAAPQFEPGSWAHQLTDTVRQLRERADDFHSEPRPKDVELLFNSAKEQIVLAQSYMRRTLKSLHGVAAVAAVERPARTRLPTDSQIVGEAMDTLDVAFNTTVDGPQTEQPAMDTTALRDKIEADFLARASIYDGADRTDPGEEL